MRMRVHQLHFNAIIPTYEHPDDSGMDIYSIEQVTLPAINQFLLDVHKTSSEHAKLWSYQYEGLNPFQYTSVVKVRTGISLEIPPYHEIQVRSRSGLASKGIFVVNGIGTIDEGYRGEICVLLANISNAPYIVNVHDRVAQLVLVPVVKAEIVVMDDNQRQSKGFGSTGS